MSSASDLSLYLSVTYLPDVRAVRSCTKARAPATMPLPWWNCEIKQYPFSWGCHLFGGREENISDILYDFVDCSSDDCHLFLQAALSVVCGDGGSLKYVPWWVQAPWAELSLLQSVVRPPADPTLTSSAYTYGKNFYKAQPTEERHVGTILEFHHLTIWEWRAHSPNGP